MNADGFKYSNYSGARSQNSEATIKREPALIMVILSSAQLEEVSKLRETTLLLFWILAPEF
jgi:hypothetical protein